MSKQHYGWWPYIRYMIRQYPARKDLTLDGIEQRERDAVKAAIIETGWMQDSAKRLSVIDRVLMYHTHTVSGAAILVPCSERTAQRWCSSFIKLVAKKFFCDGLIS